MTTILIVDDSPIDRRLAALCMEPMGIEATFAANGREALNLIYEIHDQLPKSKK